MKHLRAFQADEAGFVLSAELVIIATVVVIGLMTGLKCVQKAMIGELKDVAGAIDSLNQSYYYTGMHGCWSCKCGFHSFTRGSAFIDEQDTVTQSPCDFGIAPYYIEEESRPTVPCQPGVIEGKPSLEDSPCPNCETPGCPGGCDEAHPVPAEEAAPPTTVPSPADDSATAEGVARANLRVDYRQV